MQCTKQNSQLANCNLLHAYSQTAASPSCVSTNKNFR